MNCYCAASDYIKVWFDLNMCSIRQNFFFRQQLARQQRKKGMKPPLSSPAETGMRNLLDPIACSTSPVVCTYL